jgi:uncharacterized protein YjbJ (UPF0337 family)
MKSSTRDRVEGTGRQAKGAVQETLGRMTDRPDRRAKGAVDDATGRFQKKTGEIKKTFGR